MTKKGTDLKTLMMASITTTLLIGCGSDPSPIESMSAPIRIVRSDSICQVEDNQGRLYILNSLEMVDYNTALLKLGEEIVQRSSL